METMLKQGSNKQSPSTIHSRNGFSSVYGNSQTLNSKTREQVVTANSSVNPSKLMEAEDSEPKDASNQLAKIKSIGSESMPTKYIEEEVHPSNLNSTMKKPFAEV
jgi:hypothetical protein